ncbi:hypothetical protein ABW21_db0206964 [Orbilia brochopaga]|nr:hypothetical protein ABW21_db0206964 [Drechslerella brochopaga]
MDPDSDTDAEETYSVIDLYEDRNVRVFNSDDAVSDYFRWYEENIFGELPTQADIPDIPAPLKIRKPSNLPPVGIAETTVTTDIQTTSIGQLPPPPRPSYTYRNNDTGWLPPTWHASTTQETRELPHTTTVTGAKYTAAEREVIDYLGLDLTGRIHRLLIGSRTDEEVVISWNGADNSSRPPAFVTEKIDEVFGGMIDVIASKRRLVIQLTVHERKKLHTRYVATSILPSASDINC